MQCVLWDHCIILNFIRLNSYQTVLYFQQLQRVMKIFWKCKATFSKNHAGKILVLRSSVLPPPLHSPDPAPTDFHLFPSLHNRFSIVDQVKTIVKIFLSSKAAEFYLRGINELPDDIQEMIQNNGEYITD